MLFIFQLFVILMVGYSDRSIVRHSEFFFSYHSAFNASTGLLRATLHDCEKTMSKLIPSRNTILNKIIKALMSTLDGKKFNQALFIKYAMGTAMITDALIK